MPVRLVDAESGRTVAQRVTIARSTYERMRGLLGRDSLPPDEGMLIEKCWSIHTLFMRFPLDVAFLDSQMTVMKVVRDIAPWRITGAFGAASTLEMSAGSLQDWVTPGSRLLVQECP